MTPSKALRVNGDRLWKRLERLAQVGGSRDGGVHRLALSTEDGRARDLVVSWMREIGLEVRVDQVGNLIGLRGTGEADPVLAGSHLDTVPAGGRFDGAYGVLAALEALQVLQEGSVQTRRPVGMIAFTNEEGVRYPTDMLGSQAFAGILPVREALGVRGVDGSVVGEELARIGYAGDTPCGRLRPHAYLELHIEQGPVLEKAGIPIGLVEAITGISWQELTFLGEANHAGTTPMDARRDAGLAAGRLVAALPSLAKGIPGQKATCGRLSLEPGAVNVVPGAAVLTVDLRNADEQLLAEAERHLAELASRIARETSCQVRRTRIGYARPAACDPEVLAVIEECAAEQGVACRRMNSGAGHDAQFLARVCPTGMIFIPSRNGVSHSPQEYSSPASVRRGAQLLLAALVLLSS